MGHLFAEIMFTFWVSMLALIVSFELLNARTLRYRYNNPKAKGAIHWWLTNYTGAYTGPLYVIYVPTYEDYLKSGLLEGRELRNYKEDKFNAWFVKDIEKYKNGEHLTDEVKT
jgi:hypothetical protein